MARKKTKGPLGPLFDFLSSFGLACVLLALLFVLVLAATLTYKQVGEAGVKQAYFIPWVAHLGWFPVPGGRAIFSLLAINLFIGGLVRIRWSWRTSGVIVGHLGIVGLVLAGVVNFTQSDYGYMKLYEGQSGNTYEDYNAFELAIWDGSQDTQVHELLVGDEDLRSCAEQGRTFSHPDLPFDIELSGFLLNCQVLPKGPMWEASSPIVDQWALKWEPDSDDPNYNVAGIVARVTVDGATHTSLMTSLDVCAWTVEADGKLWAVHLHKVRHALPFTIDLIDALREDHPGTRTPRVYHSDVIYHQEASERSVRIEMNHPLREQGFVLFQSGWGLDRQGEFSGFSVARNPSDQWPKWSCWVVGLGLLMTFSMKLYQYILVQGRLRRKAA